MLESYYDINNVDRFEELYSERWIYQHPTPLRTKFLILRFNFSAISSNPNLMESSFEKHINNRASLLRLNLYLIIDEYDNFTNTLLSTYGTDAYALATHGESFYRLFFNVIKAATTGSDQALKRMFITGVSPITLDDVTSGFNIGSNLSTDYNKLRHLARLDHGLGHNISTIREVLETGHTLVPQIKTSFPALSMVKPDNFKSLLYYFGMLTIGGTDMGDVTLSIPNHVVREQMYSFLVDEYANAEVFAINLDRLVKLTKAMARQGEWKPVFQYITDELKRQSRIREFIDGEAHVN